MLQPALPAGSPESLVELLPTRACLLTRAGAVLYLNSVWREYAGRVSRHAVDRVQFVDTADRATAVTQLDSAVATDRPVVFECRLLDSAGHARWHVMHLSGHPTATGATGVLCTATDIHDVKSATSGLDERVQLLTAILDASGGCIELIAPDGSITYMNAVARRTFGAIAHPGTPWLLLLPEAARSAARDAYVSVGATGVTTSFIGRIGGPGEVWESTLTPVIAPDATTIAIVCVSRDVTAVHETQDALRRSHEQIALAVRVGGLGIWDYAIDADALECNDTWYRIMGRDPREPVRAIDEFRPFIHPDDVDRATEIEHTVAELTASGRDYSLEFRIVRPSGEIRWVRSAAGLVTDSHGVVTRAVGFVVDITEARIGQLALLDANQALTRVMQTLARENLLDPLTRTANRRQLDAELARVCTDVGVPQSVTVAMIDIDYFKPFNDRYGHLAGDDALRKVADAVRSVARRSDVVARFGGEEFVLVCPGLSDPDPMLERLTRAIADLGIPHESSPFGQITVSCGCVVFEAPHTMQPATLLDECDRALYAAKAAGRNRSYVRP